MQSSTQHPPRYERGYTRSAVPAPRGWLGPGEVDTAASLSMSSGLCNQCMTVGDVDGRMNPCWRASLMQSAIALRSGMDKG